MQELTPSLVLGDHELIVKISRGSYGEVWLARSELGTFRALKVIRRDRFDSSRPFQREFEGIQKFEPVSRSHEGLVDILHVGRGPDAGSFYYVMELADDLASGTTINPQSYRARTLGSEVQLKGPLPVAQCVHIGIQLCHTLAFLHDRGLIHRDIKPSNVIFIGNQPKLADIGLVTGIEEAKTYVGTSGFIPPEGPNSAQADVYSLGKLLYEISTGNDRNDFPALPDRTEFSDQFLELNEVLVKACNTNLQSRYRNALAMLADLELISTGRSVRRLRYLEAKLVKVRKGLSLAVAVLILAGFIFYGFNQARQHRREQAATLIGSRVAQGTALLREGDYLGSLPSFVEALRLDRNNANTQDSHRLRIGSILSASPRVLGVWQLPEKPIRSCCIRGDVALINFERKYSTVVSLNGGTALTEPIGAGSQPQMAAFVPGAAKAILTASWDESVRLIDWKTRQTLEAYDHGRTVLAADATADGRSIVSGCEDGTVFLWNRQAQTNCILGRHRGFVWGVKCSPSSKLAVTASADATARVWDLATGTERFRLSHANWVYAVDFSPDERVVASASYDFTVKLWDLQSGLEIEPALPHEAGVRSVRFSPDGHLLLTASLDGTARLWETKTHRLTEINHTFWHRGKLFDACFNDDGRKILTASSDGTLTLWDLNAAAVTPTRVAKLAPPVLADSVTSPDGLWQVRTNELDIVIQHRLRQSQIELRLKRRSPAAAFDPHSTRLALADGPIVHLVNLEQGPIQHLRHPAPVTHVQFSPDGQKLVCSSSDYSVDDLSAQIWNASTGAVIGPPLHHRDGVRYAAFSPNSQLVATASEDFTAGIWSATTGQLVTPMLRHHEKVRHVAFAHTKPWLATGSQDRTAMIWDTRTGDPLTAPLRHEKPVVSVEFVDGDTALLTTDDAGDQWRWPLPIDTRSVEQLESLIAPLVSAVQNERP